ncbi:MAG: hypothetical protein GY791_10125 [Alphaproteobacteria bacterium]|nr:hypothetical protein [Alphaproteobacteria bacterium]
MNVNRNTVLDTDNEGIRVSTDVYNGAFVDQANTITINNNSVDTVDSDGILVVNDVYSGNGDETTLLQTVNINGNTVLNTGPDDQFGGGEGIEVDNKVENYRATMWQTVNILNNSVDNGYADGIFVNTEVDDDATVFQDNTITISGNTVLNQMDDGIAVVNNLDDGATLRQTLHVDNNTVANSGDDGIFIDADVEDSSDTRHYQTATVRHNTVVNNFGEGVNIDLNVDDGAFSTQTFAIGGNSIAGNGFGFYGEGVLIDIENDDDLTTTSFFLEFYNNVIHDNMFDGFEVNHVVYNSAASGVFNAVVTNNSIVNNGDSGIEMYFKTGYEAEGGDPAVSIVDVDFIGNTVGGNMGNGGNGDGIYVSSSVFYDASAAVALEFTDNTVFLNGDDGIALHNVWTDAITGGAATMSATFGGNDINANTDDGVYLFNDGDTDELHASQTVLFIPGGNVIRNNGDYGVFGDNNDYGIQFVNLNVIAFSGNGTAYYGFDNTTGFIQTIVYQP